MAVEPVAYWVEVAKRVYAEGDDRALDAVSRFLEWEAAHPGQRMDSRDVPDWLHDVWFHSYLAGEKAVPSGFTG